MADQSAGRVSLHPCFHFGLSTASTEITGEGGTPALFLSPQMKKGKMMKKLNLMKQIVCMVGFVVTLSALAEAAYDVEKSIKVDGRTWRYCLKENGAEILGCDDATGELVIPSEICGYPVTTISDGAFEWCLELKSVTIPAGVTNIAASAFASCAIRSVVIPESVAYIGNSAFADCWDLQAMCFAGNRPKVGEAIYGREGEWLPGTGFEWWSPSTIDENLTIYVREGTSGWGEIPGEWCGRPIERWDAYPEVYGADKSIVVDGRTWRYCLQKDGVEILGCDDATGDLVILSEICGCPVIAIGESAFDNDYIDMSGLTSVTIPLGVMSIGESAFYDCFYLKSVAIPSSVTSIGYGAFERCLSLDVIYCDDRCDHVAMNRMLSESGFDVTKVKFAHCLVPGEATEIGTGLVGYKATGLPSGLKYDATTGKITGAATKPTAADGVAVKFTKSGEEDVVLTFVVWPLPTLKVAKEGDVDGCKVTGEGAYLVGKKVTLKVTTKKGTAFLGYYKGEEPWPNEADYKKTSLSYVMTRDDVSVVAKFEKEKMSVGCTGLEGCFVAGVAGAAEGIPLQVETQSGVKSVKVTKLPAGMKYDSKTGRITGAPTKVENPTVVIEVTAVSGAVEKKEIPVRVIASNEKAVGLFSGFATKDSLQDFNRVGTILLTTTAAGKLTAKVVTKKGSLSFSAASWDGIRDSHYENDGVYFVTMKTKKGEELTLELDTRASVGIGANQLTGWLKGVDTEGLRIGAQHVVFGQPWYFTASGDEALGWKLSYTADKKAAALTVTFKADGSVTIAGKLGTYKVSASRYANVSDLPSELLRADFAVVVKVGKESRVMNVNTNLRFDRTYVTDEAGEAAFAE